ncbi:FRG domain-containing protein [Burkholderia ubonensis]|uniref:FRG domain-containing protein n=1 Tax=Burkholderia ubonensis TaxID=101571 RepID=UPI0007580436|nr:FRG domain-containing protein [Burkholderia ubonensis]KVL65424.1 hypothetical protein WJ48_01520 [Burkholderia ubonensis]KVL76336.1 hypothetical protein WJ49_11580 [Burkholderia ubonensis]KVL92081.1 hypothetical protein WJ50_10725 [Burkholderia ubonensis]
MSTSSCLDPNRRDAQCVGEAADLARFLQFADAWLAGVDAMSLDFPLFRGQEVESWPLVSAIGRQPYRDRLQPGTERRMLDEFKQRALPHLESTVALADADWLAIAQHHAMPTRLGIAYWPLDANAKFRERLRYIRIPGEAFGPIRTQLQRAGINRGVRFPDLDGVAGRITDDILYRADQAPPGAGNL